MRHAVCIYPHQLFATHPGLARDRIIYLIEDPLLFGTDTQYPVRFHHQKLILHRASMQQYGAYLKNDGYDVHIVAFTQLSTSADIVKILQQDGISHLTIADPADYALRKRLETAARHAQMHLQFVATPMFLTDTTEADAFFSQSSTYRMSSFYTWQRKRLKIMVEDDGSPTGGQWSFDKENRKKLPRSITIPPIHSPHQPGSPESNAIEEARAYVDAHFPDNPGSVETFRYPITHSQAVAWLEQFFAERFDQFGPYEDTFAPDEPFLFHSVISSSLNIGLLTPEQVISMALEWSAHNDLPIASVEGFIRQIIGWREYMRLLYEREGSTMRRSNHLNHHRTLSADWYRGSTGLDPVDDTISQVLAHAYTHHIPRLMILGNSMMLCTIDPSEVYRWFMELFIDAYDWVMVPNVYAMSQFSATGLITTKPYISSSNYIRSMGRYQKGDWCEIWDALFWSFVIKNLHLFEGNGRMQFVASRAQKLSSSEKASYRNVAEEFISAHTDP